MTPAALASPLPRGSVRPDRPSFYERQVLKAFERMTTGHLRLELPHGQTLSMGRPGAEVQALIRVRDLEFFRRCVLFGDVGFGESYVHGEWETDSLERVISWAIANLENTPSMSGSRVRNLALNLLQGYNRLSHLLRPNDLRGVRRNISEHYDLGNDFYALWLDRTMTYSGGLFAQDDQSLEAAQLAKYDALCRKLQLRPTDHLLEIGCGWGGFAARAVQRYGCRVTAITISEQQFNYARERFRREGVADRVDLRMEDYRRTTGQFDKIVSIEMMEALGARYVPVFCRKVSELLRPDGLAALQFITVPDSRHRELARGVDWIQKHIFPGSLLLSVGQVNAAFNRTSDLFLHDLQDLGASYALTLRRWWKNFNGRLKELEALGFDARFVRKWNYYLQYCEAAFASRNISVVQALYTRPNNRHLNFIG